MLNYLRDVFASLHAHDVKYVVIGGIAAILHGVPRTTFDLDILIEATPNNAQRLLDAFIDAGLGTATLISADELLENEVTIFKDGCGLMCRLPLRAYNLTMPGFRKKP